MKSVPTETFYVLERDGRPKNTDLNEIAARIRELCDGLNREFVDPFEVATRVFAGLYPGVTSTELDDFIAETAATMTTRHPDYALLAARIAVFKLHKETKETFTDVISDLRNIENELTGRRTSIISDECYDVIMRHADRLNASIVHDRDFNYNYFGFKTLEKSYLLRIKGKIVERPQHMLMRVSLGIHGEDIDAAVETYNLMSAKYFTHASPTLFNSATSCPQLSSCFLVAMKEDSLEGIFDTLRTCALITKSAGGVGLHIHNIRATNSYIAGTNGLSTGIVPMLRVFNDVSRSVNQGGNKRPGAFAIYLEPWHADIFDFLELRKNTGETENRTRDLFSGLWIPDEFMRRVEMDEKWSLMCPNNCPGLSDVFGDEFDHLYRKYESEGNYVRQVQARDLWRAITNSQVETGTPYMLYKDACNRKSNQRNLGTIKSSNLCTEIIQYSSADEVAVCNLASIAVNMFVNSDRSYDFHRLKEVTKTVARNLNKIIDVNYYPVPEARNSNLRHRPIGIGIQGLADLFILMRLPFESLSAQQMNVQVFETIYYGALEASCELAERYGPYDSYQGSPVSQGVLQYDMWGVTPSSLWNWAELKERIKKFGVRNSLLIAPMPTAATAQILGNNESFEPYTSNMYVRRVLSGEFQVVNHHLLRDLVELGLWDENMKNELILNNGSVQNIARIPDDLKMLYKTAWEIKQKTVLKMAADRAPFIDQSQSLNIHLAHPTYAQLCSMHFYGWKAGLKTGMYYLRTKPAANPIQFTVDKMKITSQINDVKQEKLEKKMCAMTCSRQNDADCAGCH